MKTIAHVSDLHFGAETPALVAALEAALRAAKPDLLVVSGDLTQRARKKEFEGAKQFLSRQPFRQIVVPGNHDLEPFFRPLRRLFYPLAGFNQHFSDDPAPFYLDDEIAVIGINSARALSAKGGRVNRGQVENVCAKLAATPESLLRFVVTHHPFDLPEGNRENELVGRAKMAMSVFAGCRVDVFLSGHLHRVHSSECGTRYGLPGHSAIVVQAGTAVSHRTRGEVNSWNLLHAARERLSITRMLWKEEENSFQPLPAEHFQHTDQGWKRG